MNSLPTMYRGIKFRSLLEARWACFFDLLGWRYQYEPVDFNGWIPDFALFGKETIYVEVKPYDLSASLPEEISLKIDRADCPQEVLVVGLSPVWGETDNDYWAHYIGFVRETVSDVDYEGVDNGSGWWQEATFGQWTGTNKLGFCARYGSYHDRISGQYDGGCCGRGYYDVDSVKELWAQACNIVRWQPRESKGD